MNVFHTWTVYLKTVKMANFVKCILAQLKFLKITKIKFLSVSQSLYLYIFISSENEGISIYLPLEFSSCMNDQVISFAYFIYWIYHLFK